MAYFTTVIPDDSTKPTHSDRCLFVYLLLCFVFLFVFFLFLYLFIYKYIYTFVVYIFCFLGVGVDDFLGTRQSYTKRGYTHHAGNSISPSCKHWVDVYGLMCLKSTNCDWVQTTNLYYHLAFSFYQTNYIRLKLSIGSRKWIAVDRHKQLYH